MSKWGKSISPWKLKYGIFALGAVIACKHNLFSKKLSQFTIVGCEKETSIVTKITMPLYG